MALKTRYPSETISRREFIKTSLSAGTGVFIASNPLTRIWADSTGKKRYAIVGLGSRSYLYQNAILKTFQQNCAMVGYCDVNLGRLQLAQQEALERTGREIPIYDAQDFDRMIAETQPQVIIVTTVDGFHHQYICRAMELGCDVITEKPMTIDAQKCQQIIDTQRSTGRKCTVTFNYRYSPPRTQVKELLLSGVIGAILSVDFHWMLNTHHGADYFRRWHSQKAFSGGLMVHKATHHFDLVNWWLSAIPVTVTAVGKREFYTPGMAQRFGLTGPHERCLTCPEKKSCGFELDLARDRWLKKLYLENERHDGYFRDRCVFRPDIDIEDTMNVLALYDNSVTLCYSLNAFNSWEGYAIVFNGTKGRLEHKAEEQIYVSGTDTVQGGLKEGGVSIRIFPLRGAFYDVDPWQGAGGHGGGDDVMLQDIFGPGQAADKYLRAADQRAGAYALLTGAAANLSFNRGETIKIADLVSNLAYPDYPEMPSKTASIPMPGKN